MTTEKIDRLDALSSLSLTRPLTTDELAEMRKLNRQLAKIKTPEEEVLSKRSRNNRRKGKNNERALAKKLGGVADGLPGHQDISAGPFSVEVKAGGHLPKKIVNGLLECDRLGHGKTSVLCVRSSEDKGLYHHSGVVCMWEEDFVSWFDMIKEKKE